MMPSQISRPSSTAARVGCLLTLGLLGGLLCNAAPAQTPRALPHGELPKDVRLQPLKDLDGYFPFEPAETAAAWAARAERVRRQMLVTLGLWPMPTRTPLAPVIPGRVEREDYTVEKIHFQSLPGFYVTGSLYRPKGRSGKVPGVLCPHGHWSDGRFHDNTQGVRREIVQGAERFEEGGGSPLQARCVQLARMGCVVFHYDMIGYADSQQIPSSIAHGFAKQRPEMNDPAAWGLFSPQAEAQLQSVMGLQTWNSIRSLDFLCGLPEVDGSRIGVTGASGGGTQTFILSAIDPRPTVAFPAVMVSTAMQGGCTCENACGLRVGTGNVEFAALFAPKPLGMTAADDWTREMETKGFPELRKHYTLLGAPDNVMLKPLLHFGHNYNYVSRAALYSWFNKHLKLGLQDPIVEEDYRRLTTAEMSVWNDQHPKPQGGPEFERNLLQWLAKDAAEQLRASQSSPAQFREACGPAVDVIIGRGLAEAGTTQWLEKQQTDRGDYTESVGLLRNTTHGEELPVVRLQPKNWKGPVAIWTDPAGKSALFLPQGPQPTAEAQQLLQAGWALLGVDLLHQGEFLADGQPLARTPRVKNPREAAAYTFGYNHAVFAQRVHDLLTAIAFLRTEQPAPKSIHLVGLRGAGVWVAAAQAQAGPALASTVVDTAGFRFAQVRDIHHPNFLPGGAKYGDLPGFLALGSPRPLFLAGESGQGPECVRQAYEKEGALAKLTLFADALDQAPAAAAKWLLAQAGL